MPCLVCESTGKLFADVCRRLCDGQRDTEVSDSKQAPAQECVDAASSSRKEDAPLHPQLQNLLLHSCNDGEQDPADECVDAAIVYRKENDPLGLLLDSSPLNSCSGGEQEEAEECVDAASSFQNAHAPVTVSKPAMPEDQAEDEVVEQQRLGSEGDENTLRAMCAFAAKSSGPLVEPMDKWNRLEFLAALPEDLRSELESDRASINQLGSVCVIGEHGEAVAHLEPGTMTIDQLKHSIFEKTRVPYQRQHLFVNVDGVCIERLHGEYVHQNDEFVLVIGNVNITIVVDGAPVLEVWMNAVETIGALKAEIREQLQMELSNQRQHLRLQDNDFEPMDCDTLQGLGIVGHCVFHFAGGPATGCLDICVSGDTGVLKLEDCSESLTVCGLKKILFDRNGVPQQHQHLFCKGQPQELHNDSAMSSLCTGMTCQIELEIDKVRIEVVSLSETLYGPVDLPITTMVGDLRSMVEQLSGRRMGQLYANLVLGTRRLSDDAEWLGSFLEWDKPSDRDSIVTVTYIPRRDVEYTWEEVLERAGVPACSVQTLIRSMALQGIRTEDDMLRCMSRGATDDDDIRIVNQAKIMARVFRVQGVQDLQQVFVEATRIMMRRRLEAVVAP